MCWRKSPPPGARRRRQDAWEDKELPPRPEKRATKSGESGGRRAGSAGRSAAAPWTQGARFRAQSTSGPRDEEVRSSVAPGGSATACLAFGKINAAARLLGQVDGEPVGPKRRAKGAGETTESTPRRSAQKEKGDGGV